MLLSDGLGEFVERPTVLGFELGAAAEEILQLADERHLRIRPLLQASQLIGELSANF